MAEHGDIEAIVHRIVLQKALIESLGDNTPDIVAAWQALIELEEQLELALQRTTLPDHIETVGRSVDQKPRLGEEQ